MVVPFRRHQPALWFGGSVGASLLRKEASERNGESAEDHGGSPGRDEGRCDSRRYADRAYLELTDASQSIYLAKAPLDRRPSPAAPQSPDTPRYLSPMGDGERRNEDQRMAGVGGRDDRM